MRKSLNLINPFQNLIVFSTIIILCIYSLKKLYVNFSALGVSLNENFETIPIALIVYLFYFTIQSQIKNTFTKELLSVVLYFLILPMSTLMIVSNKSPSYFFAVSTLIISGFYISDKLKPVKNNLNILLTNRQFIFVTTTPIIIFILEAIRLGGLSYFNLDLTTVYDYRFTLREVYTSITYKYLFGWVKSVFIPALVIYGSIYKSRTIILFTILISIVIFGVSSHKSALFSALLIIFLYRYFGSLSKIISITLLILFTVQLISSNEINLYLENFIIHRLVFIPSILNYTYYEFFTNNSFIFYSDKLMSSFLSYDYSLPYANLIGYELFYREEVVANASMFATGYAHLGYIGVFLYCVIMTLILWLLNSLSKNKPSAKIVFCVNFLPLLDSFISADLLTSILTGGLFISIPLSYILINLMKKERNENHTFLIYKS